MIAKPSGFLRPQSPNPVSRFHDHDQQTQWVLEISITNPSGFRDHNRQTQCVLEILITKHSGFRHHDRQTQWVS